MSKYEEALDVIEDAILEVAKQARTANSYTNAERWSAAVLNLAEARAWMISPSQPHGGSSYSKGGSS